MISVIDSFVRRVDAEGLPVEAIMVYQGDKLRAEHRWVADVPRNIFSHTKSFMSSAVGMAIGDGALSLSDRPVDFFPEAMDAGFDERLREIRLRDLLMMSSGIGQSLLMMPGRYEGVGAPDYARFVFSHGMKEKPGAKFLYSNGDSYLAGRMAEKAVGRTLRDYLDERLFRPLEIPYPEWEHCPMGHTFGASGLKLRTEDMGKLGRLYLQGGVWHGRQIIPAEWVREATRKQIETSADPNGWSCGYGYQFWMSPYEGAYRADGAYGQFSCVFPASDAVVVVQCAERDCDGRQVDALREEVFPKL